MRVPPAPKAFVDMQKPPPTGMPASALPQPSCNLVAAASKSSTGTAECKPVAAASANSATAAHSNVDWLDDLTDTSSDWVSRLKEEHDIVNVGEKSFRCHLCNVSLSSYAQIKGHVESRRHQNKITWKSEKVVTRSTPASTEKRAAKVARNSVLSASKNRSTPHYRSRTILVGFEYLVR